MPAMLRIDTLKFARSLTDAGMDRRQAEALVQGLSDADTSDFATKADVGELKADVGASRWMWPSSARTWPGSAPS